MIVKQNSFNTITIVNIIDNLYNNFEITTASMLKTRNKTIEDI